MSLFGSRQNEAKRSGVLGAFSVDVIKWEPKTDEEASLIVHRFEAEDFPSGSQLIVNPSQMAVFVNNLSAGSSQQVGDIGDSQVAVFIGPCKIKLETGDSRFAPFRRISHALTGGESAYHSTVYFINTTYMNELNWGTQAPIVVVDPEEEINVHVRAFGLFGAHIEQTDTGIAAVQASKLLRKVSGTRADFSRDQLVSFMRAKILEYVPDMLAKSIIDKQISVLKISAYMSEFSQAAREYLIPHFDDFGLSLDNFSFHSINVPEEDLAAINEIKIQKKRNRLEAEGAAVKMDIESAARARMREREGFTYQQEQSFDVLRTAAGNEGTAGGLMGAGMGLGVGLGLGGGMGDATKKLFDASDAPAPKTEGMVCPQCKASIPEGARFCQGCGSKILQEQSKCAECGASLAKGAKFCHQCGKQASAACSNCGATNAGNASFCSECGTKL